jgi:flagellin-like hook-associated protein FlgL
LFITKVKTDSTRAGIGATINQAYSSINVNLTNVVQKRSANSEIADTDMASAYTTLNSQLLQSNSAMFASAHSTSYLAMQASRLLS